MENFEPFYNSDEHQMINAVNDDGYANEITGNLRRRHLQHSIGTSVNRSIVGVRIIQSRLPDATCTDLCGIPANRFVSLQNGERYTRLD